MDIINGCPFCFLKTAFTGIWRDIYAHKNPLTKTNPSLQGRSATYLKNHIRTVHLEEVHTVACPHCEYTSDTRSDLDMHVDHEHIGGGGGGNNGDASPPEEASGKEKSVITL